MVAVELLELDAGVKIFHANGAIVFISESWAPKPCWNDINLSLRVASVDVPNFVL